MFVLLQYNSCLYLQSVDTVLYTSCTLIRVLVFLNIQEATLIGYGVLHFLKASVQNHHEDDLKEKQVLLEPALNMEHLVADKVLSN